MSEKEEIEAILARATIDKNEAFRVIRLKNEKGNYLSVNRISEKDFSVLYSYFDFNMQDTIKAFVKVRKVKEVTIKRNIYSFSSYYKRLGIDFEDIRKKKKENQDNINRFKAEQTKVNNIVNKVSDFVSFFNVSTDGLASRIANIQKTNDVNQEDYIKELFILREMFIGKARGEITTQQTEALYEVEEDENGKLIRKSLSDNKIGKKLMNIKTQSHLPDEKSLVAIKVLDEMILQAQSSNNIELTEDELKNKYIQYLENARKERLIFLENVI